MPYDIPYMWNLKYNTNELIYETNRLMVAEGVGEGWSGSLGLADANYEIIEWINNKVLLYSPGNCIQYPVINHDGKEYEKEYIYMYN